MKTSLFRELPRLNSIFGLVVPRTKSRGVEAVAPIHSIPNKITDFSRIIGIKCLGCLSCASCVICMNKIASLVGSRFRIFSLVRGAMRGTGSVGLDPFDMIYYLESIRIYVSLLELICGLMM